MTLLWSDVFSYEHPLMTLLKNFKLYFFQRLQVWSSFSVIWVASIRKSYTIASQRLPASFWTAAHHLTSHFASYVLKRWLTLARRPMARWRLADSVCSGFAVVLYEHFIIYIHKKQVKQASTHDTSQVYIHVRHQISCAFGLYPRNRTFMLL